MSKTHIGYKTATVFGGTGFLGRHIVRGLAKQGFRVKVATRVPERAYFLRTCGVVGQIVPFACDYRDAVSIRNAVAGSDCVINCIGILFEKGKKRTFRHAHIDIASAIAEACAAHRVERLVHVSALGCDMAGSSYAKTKYEGEQAVRTHFAPATILRPSVMFGENDNFFNMFARMAALSPVLPLIGGGRMKFQPVYIGDVADAAINALLFPTLGAENPQGRIYELGGPEILTLREIYERMFRYTGQKKKLISVPFGFAKMKAFFLELLPTPLLTRDQIESLRTDNILSGNYPMLENLGVTPTGLELILPAYLERYRPGGRFAVKDA